MCYICKRICMKYFIIYEIEKKTKKKLLSFWAIKVEIKKNQLMTSSSSVRLSVHLSLSLRISINISRELTKLFPISFFLISSFQLMDYFQVFVSYRGFEGGSTLVSLKNKIIGTISLQSSHYLRMFCFYIQFNTESLLLCTKGLMLIIFFKEFLLF